MLLRKFLTLHNTNSTKVLWKNAVTKRLSTPMTTLKGADDEDDDNNNDMETSPFPRLGWSPGSFGARALRKSKARKPGEATGRTKPKKTEEDYWMEAYEAYGVPSRENKSETDNDK